jgi:hypothetical protein
MLTLFQCNKRENPQQLMLYSIIQAGKTWERRKALLQFFQTSLKSIEGFFWEKSHYRITVLLDG